MPPKPPRPKKPSKITGQMRKEKQASRTPKSMFTLTVGDTGLTKYELWVQFTLDLYMSYREVVEPKLDADGSVQLDRFGRPRTVPYEEFSLEKQDRIQKGAVWFTKATLKRAWFNLFEQDDYALMDPSSYMPKFKSDIDALNWAASRGTATDTQQRQSPRAPKRSYAHPMDRVFGRMVEDGRIIKKSTGRYFFRRDVCASVDRLHVWDEHIRRGEVWEDLRYEIEMKRTQDVATLRRTKVHEHEWVDFYYPRTRASYIKHPRQAQWEEVLESLDRYILFDRRAVEEAAVRVGLMTEEEARTKAMVPDHIVRWFETDKIDRVFPGLYRTKGFWLWNSQRDRFVKPLEPLYIDWLIAFFKDWSEKQLKDPNLVFRNEDVIAFIDSHMQAVIDFWCPNGIKKGTINARLRESLTKGYIEYAAPRRFRLKPYVFETFEPLWSEPSGRRIDVREAELLQRELLIEGLPINKALDELSDQDAPSVYMPLVRRIFSPDVTGHAQEEYARRFCKVMNWSLGQLHEVRKKYKIEDVLGF